MVTHIISALFKLGECRVTAGIHERYMKTTEGNLIINDLMERHANKDYGDIPEEDIELNRLAHEEGNRIFSMYHVNDDTIYIITEADRSVTTVLFYDEY